jgi:hypothetical protein
MGVPGLGMGNRIPCPVCTPPSLLLAPSSLHLPLSFLSYRQLWCIPSGYPWSKYLFPRSFYSRLSSVYYCILSYLNIKLLSLVRSFLYLPDLCVLLGLGFVQCKLLILGVLHPNLNSARTPPFCRVRVSPRSPRGVRLVPARCREETHLRFGKAGGSNPPEAVSTASCTFFFLALFQKLLGFLLSFPDFATHFRWFIIVGSL